MTPGKRGASGEPAHEFGETGRPARQTWYRHDAGRACARRCGVELSPVGYSFVPASECSSRRVGATRPGRGGRAPIRRATGNGGSRRCSTATRSPRTLVSRVAFSECRAAALGRGAKAIGAPAGPRHDRNRRTTRARTPAWVWIRRGWSTAAASIGARCVRTARWPGPPLCSSSMTVCRRRTNREDGCGRDRKFDKPVSSRYAYGLPSSGPG
jgi:hypothetical protein